MRLFVAVWPPDEILQVIDDLDRPVVAGVRWTAPAQWHVTLRFLGEVPAGQAGTVARALAAGAQAVQGPVQATMGPVTAWFPGRRVLQVPVAGLDELAGVVGGVTATFGRHREERRFAGHLTLARVGGRVQGPPWLAGRAVAGTWPVRAVHLVASDRRPDGARYRSLAVVRLGGGWDPTPNRCSKLQ